MTSGSLPISVCGKTTPSSMQRTSLRCRRSARRAGRQEPRAAPPRAAVSLQSTRGRGASQATGVASVADVLEEPLGGQLAAQAPRPGRLVDLAGHGPELVALDVAAGYARW